MGNSSWVNCLKAITGVMEEPLPNNEEEDDLIAKIGDREISSGEILDCLIVRKDWQAIENCLDQFFIEEAFTKYDIQASDADLANYMTAFRQKNQLASAEDTRHWLDNHHMDDDDFVQLCQYELKLEKLKDRLFQDKLEEVFVYQKQALQSIELYKIVVAGEEAALEIVSSVKEGASFFDYARKYSIDSKTAKQCGYAGEVKVKELPPHVQDLLIKGQAGDVLGPLKVNKCFEIYLTTKIEAPILDDECRRQLMDDMFAEWLADSKARANIELFI